MRLNVIAESGKVRLAVDANTRFQKLLVAAQPSWSWRLRRSDWFVGLLAQTT